MIHYDTQEQRQVRPIVAGRCILCLLLHLGDSAASLLIVGYLDQRLDGREKSGQKVDVVVRRAQRPC